MNYEVDQEGTIAVPLSVNQAYYIKKLLLSKHTQLRKESAPAADCDEIFTILVAVDNAVISGMKQKQSPPSKPKLVSVYGSKQRVPKRGFLQSLRNFFDPPFSVMDFDSAVTLSGQKHYIIQMDFSEAGRSHPYNVTGEIFFLGAYYKARWNSHGYCECNDLHPDDLRGFHLIRFDHHDTLSVGTTLFLLFLVGLFIFLIFKFFIQ
ncbi:MAG: hypothetical protein WCI31_06185 [Prolixibacteraceae bacterium]